MEYEEQGEPWPRIKEMPLDQLELNQWRLFDPTLPTPGGLHWNRFRDWLTRGKIAHAMLHGRFSGGPPVGPGTMYHAQQWFRFAAHSIAIRPTADGLFQRAMNGTINAGGDALRYREFLGFNAEGREIRYDYTCAFIDLEVIIRRWPPSPMSVVLQGILLSKVMDAGVSRPTSELVRLARDFLAQDTADIPEGLRRYASECRSRLTR